MKAWPLILFAALLAWPAMAQFVEVGASLEITRWQYQEDTGLPLKNTHTYAVHCVAGTNVWLIEHQPRTNTTESSWFVNGKIIRITAVSRESYLGDSDVLPGRRVSRTASILPAPDGYAGGDLVLNVPWFAFCSGPFLKSSPRGVPVPTSPPNRMAFGFTNETTFFEDSFKLPKRAAFYVAPKQLKCLYEVQQSTNVLGWSFPLAFKATHYEKDSFGKWNREVTVIGQVTSIRPAPEFAVPDELIELMEQREQPVTRRRQFQQ